MGVILAKFRKEKTTYEILEDLETKIKDIEDFSISTQERQKRFVGNFLVISIGLYVIGSIIFYFAFFPSTWSKRIVYSTPLLIFPILIIFLKRLVAWFFQRKLNRNANQLKTLRAEKKKIIEQVMDKETYKVALEILNRFADSSTRMQQQQQMAGGLRSPNTTLNQSTLGTGLITPQKIAPPKITVSPYTAQIQQRPQFTGAPTVRTPINARSIASSTTQAVSPLPMRPYQAGVTPVGVYGAQSPNFQAHRIVQHHQQQHTPYPIINQNQKSLFEKVVDYLIGDGPSSRYGMICKECYGHNGMVSQEEYEYSAFKCAFCKALNPARKLRPIGPRLPLATNKPSGEVVGGGNSFNSKTVRAEEQNSSASVSEKDSGSDSEPISLNEMRELTDTNRRESELNAKTIETISATINTNEIEQPETNTDENTTTVISTTSTDLPPMTSELKTDIDKKNE